MASSHAKRAKSDRVSVWTREKERENGEEIVTKRNEKKKSVGGHRFAIVVVCGVWRLTVLVSWWWWGRGGGDAQNAFFGDALGTRSQKVEKRDNLKIYVPLVTTSTTFIDGIPVLSHSVFFQISQKTSEKMLPICLFDWEFDWLNGTFTI